MKIRVILAAVIVVCGVRMGHAQVGSGWKEIFPQRSIEIETHGKYSHYPYTKDNVAEEGASYSRADGIETFKLFNHDASNRSEIVVEHKWTSGLHQFEGDLRVSNGTDNESCMQVFGREKVNGNGGPVAMLRHSKANDGGLRLSCNKNSTDLVTDTNGKWVHVNVIHDDDKNTVTVYLDGQQFGPVDAPSGDRDKAGASYFKYGCYGSLHTEAAQVEWRNLKFFER